MMLCTSYGYNPTNIIPSHSTKHREELAKKWNQYNLDPTNPDDAVLAAYKYYSEAFFKDLKRGIPANAHKELLELLAENGAIAVDGNKLIPVSELKNIPSNIVDNEITGYDDNPDEIYGGEGDDHLIGKSGDDTLNGGKGNDTLEGGEGSDTYYAGETDVIIDSDGKGEVLFQTKGGHLEAYYKNKGEQFLEHLERLSYIGVGDTPIYERADEDSDDFPDKLQKGLLTYATLTSYTPGSSTAVFAHGHLNEDEKGFYTPFRYEVKGLRLPRERPDSPLVDFTAQELIITPINAEGETVGKSLIIKKFRNGQLGINLLDIMSYRYPYFGGYPSFYAHTPPQSSVEWGGKKQRQTGDNASDLNSPKDKQDPFRQPESRVKDKDRQDMPEDPPIPPDPQREPPEPKKPLNPEEPFNPEDPEPEGDDGNDNDPSQKKNTSPPPNKGRIKPNIYDPLALDLDGDGLETVSYNGRRGPMFDYDGDGIRTATGWLAADDGFLVLDRNRDGQINHAGELFSDLVRLSDSTLSEHGFAALADIDENKDGMVNSTDNLFASLQVWRDLNQNGISESEELFGLDKLGIKALYTTYENRNDILNGRNILAQVGQYEKQDGSFGMMGDVNFRYSPFYSKFTDAVALTEEQPQGINLNGIGRVRDLREAAALSAPLNEILQRYAIENNREAQLALLPELLHLWAQTDSRYRDYTQSLQKAVESDDADAVSVHMTPRELEAFRNAVADPTVMQRFDENKHKIATLNSLYALNIDKLYYMTDKDIDYITDKISNIYQNTLDYAYRSLLLQTRP